MKTPGLVSWIIFLLMFIFLIQVEGIGYCSSYCDLNGYYHESFYCHEPSAYCCGTAYRRGCCGNRTYDITNYYPEQYNCNSGSWVQVHWQVLITMTGSILLVLLFSACCCQCCRICQQRVEHAHRVRFNSNTTSNVIVTDTDGNQYLAEPGDASAVAAGGGQVSIQMFNPESPYAFTPPDYDEELPKDPPKYNEIFTSPDGGAVNPCYVPDSPPPPFSEVDGATGPPLPLAENRETNNSTITSGSPEVVATVPEVVHARPEVQHDLEVSSATAEAETENARASRDEPDVVRSVGPTSLPDAEGFVDVDLTADDAVRPLTSSHNAPRQQEVAQEEAREYCLGESRDTEDNSR